MLIPKGGITPPAAALVSLYESGEIGKIVAASLINHCLANSINAVVCTPRYCEEALRLDANVKKELTLDMKAVNTALLEEFDWLNEWTSLHVGVKAHVLGLKPKWQIPGRYWETRRQIYTRCSNLFAEGDPWLEVTNKSVTPDNIGPAPDCLRILYQNGSDSELVVTALLNHCYHERVGVLVLDSSMWKKAVAKDPNIKRTLNITSDRVLKHLLQVFDWKNEHCRRALPSISHSVFVLKPEWAALLKVDPEESNQLLRERYMHLFSKAVNC